jgi:HlyD family secretion protein
METGLGRTLWLIVGIALALTAVLVFLSGRGTTARVTVTDVAREPLSSMVSTNGKVEPIVPVSFRAGFPTLVAKVLVVEGQQVKQGQPLFVLEDTAVAADLARARADLAAQEEALRAAQAGGRADQSARAAAELQKAQAAREQLRHDNEALTKLTAQRAATMEELEKNRLALAQAEADVLSLEKVKQTIERQAKFDTERVALLVEHDRNEIRDLEGKIRSAHATAPIDGTLYSLPIRTGDYAKEGDLLAEMADLRHVRVRAFIDQPELGQLAVNQTVDILWDAHPDRTWSGRTEILPKQVVPHGTRNVGELLCSVNNDRLDLLPNTTVDVQIHVSERPNVLVVPRGAVFTDGGRRFVFREEDDHLHRVEIKVGIVNATMIEVVSGLKLGDVVALPGETPLKENLRVRPVRQE